MKKIIIILVLTVSFLNFIKITPEENIIPDEAIRFRVIANSNTVYDQNIKIQIRNEVQNKILELTKDSQNINETRRIIKDNLSNINSIIAEKIKKLNYDKSYKINYGKNYFPEKKYKGITYKEGKYESLVITLGDGAGENWWCVLFPPLCVLETEDEKSNDVEYKFFVKEIISKFKN